MRWIRLTIIMLLIVMVSTLCLSLAFISLSELLKEDIAIIMETWSPDDIHLAYIQEIETAEGCCLRDLYIREVDGKPQRLTNNIVVMGFQWSPDGTKIAFTDDRNQIYLVNVDRFDLTEMGRGRLIAWSQDSTRIAFYKSDTLLSIEDAMWSINVSTKHSIPLSDIREFYTLTTP